MSDETTRLKRLQELAGECIDVYDGRAQDVLDELTECPRFALLTVEPAYEDNPNLTVHDDLGSVARQIEGELNEFIPWHPERVVDLDNGEPVEFTVEHKAIIGEAS